MSHFVGLCFGDDWENQLDYYYEGREVEDYIKYTKQEAITRAKESHERNYEYAIKEVDRDKIAPDVFKQLNEIIDKGLCISDEVAWEMVKDWGYKIDEEGNILSTYNPDSKWDWYSIGGRWSGYLPLKARDEAGNPIEANEAYCDEIDWEYLLKEKFTPFCYIDLDGDWHEKGEMGWFACVTNEKGQNCWDQEFKDFIESLDCNCLVTVVDFHI